MASKQKLFKQYKELYREYLSLLNKEYDLKEDRFYNKNTSNDMMVFIQNLERKINDKKYELAIAKWFETEEGSKWRTNKTARLAEIMAERKSLIDELRAVVRPLILDVLGEGWDITELYYTRMSISMIEKNEKGETVAKFGHSFEFSWYDNPWYDNPDFGKKFHLSFGYGTMGSFDIDKQPSRVEVVVGMAKILGNKELLSKLNKVIGKFNVADELLTKEKYEIEDELRNPPLPKDE